MAFPFKYEKNVAFFECFDLLVRENSMQQNYYYSAMMIPVLGTETQRTRRGCGFFMLKMNRSMQCIILERNRARYRIEPGAGFLISEKMGEKRKDERSGPPLIRGRKKKHEGKNPSKEVSGKTSKIYKVWNPSPQTRRSQPPQAGPGVGV